MKIVVIILSLMTAAALIATVTGVEHVALAASHVTVTHHGSAGRAAAAAVGLICGIAAYGCAKRKVYAWWIVTTMLVLLIAYAVIWTIWKMNTTDLDFFGNLLGALGQGVKIAALVWFLVAWWMPRKKEFKRSGRYDPTAT